MEIPAVRIVLLVSALACMVIGKTYLAEPNLYYECEKNSTIVITGKNVSYGSVHAVEQLSNGKNLNCSVIKNNNTLSVTFTITNCNVKSTITVYMMEETQTTEITVLGGKGLILYQLKCNGIEKGGMNITEDFNLTDGDDVTPHTHFQKDVNLTMEVKDHLNQSLTPSSTVLIGETLQLIVSGNSGFTFAAQSCKATEAAIISKGKNLTHDGLTYDPSLISNFSILQNYSGHDERVEIEATLYAFHFLGSDNIAISCIITVCESDDESCPIKKEKGRRRRAVGVEHYTQSLQATFRVVDTESNVVTKNVASEASGSSGGSNWRLLLILVYVMSGIFEFHA